MLSIDSKEFHRGYAKRGNFAYDVKLPRGLEAGSHRMGAECRGSKHTPARFTVKDKKHGWDEGCEEEGYGNDEENGYDENVGYDEDCEDDEGDGHKHRRRAWFNVSPDMVTAGDKVWAEGAGCKRYASVKIKLDGGTIKRTYADKWGTFDKGVRFPTTSARVATYSAPSAMAATSALTASRSRRSTTSTTTACTPTAASSRPARS